MVTEHQEICYFYYIFLLQNLKQHGGHAKILTLWLITITNEPPDLVAMGLKVLQQHGYSCHSSSVCEIWYHKLNPMS